MFYSCKLSLTFLIASISIGIGNNVNANEIDENFLSKNGLEISGTIRGQYAYTFDSNPSTSKFDFSDAVLWIDFEKHNVFGHLDYRAYQFYNHFADVNYLTVAYLGYKFNENSKISAGINPVPIGLGRYQGSNYNLTLLYAMGLEDISNLGGKYEFNNSNYEFNVGFYPTHAGNYSGKSKDSRRYSSNLVNEDRSKSFTSLDEKNIVTLRAVKKFNNSSNDSVTEVGVSGWHGQIENLNNNKSGVREVYTVFAKSQLGHYNISAMLGQQSIKNKDDTFSDYSTFGLNDGSFNVANDGKFLVTEINKNLEETPFNLDSMKIYLNYSSYLKGKSDFDDSHRLVAGVATSKKNVNIQGEFLMGKNDYYLGHNYGLAQGNENASWNKKLFISFGYKF